LESHDTKRFHSWNCQLFSAIASSHLVAQWQCPHVVSTLMRLDGSIVTATKSYSDQMVLPKQALTVRRHAMLTNKSFDIGMLTHTLLSLSSRRSAVAAGVRLLAASSKVELADFVLLLARPPIPSLHQHHLFFLSSQQCLLVYSLRSWHSL
jgi:hypothetical protein